MGMKILSKIASLIILSVFGIFGVALILFVFLYTIGFSIGYFKTW